MHLLLWTRRRTRRYSESSFHDSLVLLLLLLVVLGFSNIIGFSISKGCEAEIFSQFCFPSSGPASAWPDSRVTQSLSGHAIAKTPNFPHNVSWGLGTREQRSQRDWDTESCLWGFQALWRSETAKARGLDCLKKSETSVQFYISRFCKADLSFSRHYQRWFQAVTNILTIPAVQSTVIGLWSLDPIHWC